MELLQLRHRLGEARISGTDQRSASSTRMPRGIPNPLRTPHCPRGPRAPASTRSYNCELSPSLCTRICQAKQDVLDYKAIRTQLSQDPQTGRLPFSTTRNTVYLQHTHTGGITGGISNHVKDGQENLRSEKRIVASGMTSGSLHQHQSFTASNFFDKRIVTYP